MALDLCESRSVLLVKGQNLRNAQLPSRALDQAAEFGLSSIGHRFLGALAHQG